MPIKDTITFQCGKGMILFKYVNEYKDEFASGTPVLRRVYIHNDHAHLLKFDVQGGDRGNDIMDFYENSKLIKGKINVEYTCEVCNQYFKFAINPKEQSENHANIDLGIPSIGKNYQFIHIHKSGTVNHAYHFRVDLQGRIQLSKYVKFIAL